MTDQITPAAELDGVASPSMWGRGERVVVTSGLLESMSKREVEGVLAHEVSHIRNRDVRLMTLAAVLVGDAQLDAEDRAPLLRLNVEGPDEATMARVRDEVLALIRG